MKEAQVIVILSVVLLAFGAAAVYFESFSSDFNFYKSELSVDGTRVNESVTFSTNEPYHTLFRNFDDELFLNGKGTGNYVGLINVECDSGEAYLRDFSSVCYDFKSEPVRSSCQAYTEKNEYGCTFGNVYGFQSGEDYRISSEFELHPENLFEIRGEYYVKFIVYSRGNHKYLNEDNFIVHGNVVRNGKYYPDEYVIVYIPFRGDVSGYNIQSLDDFEFDSPHFVSKIFFMLLPILLLIFTWYYTGRELSYEDVPEQLSFWPMERKSWQVAAFFNPPFGNVDEKFISTLLIDFYHRKIIDIKSKEKDILIKLNEPKDMDSIEQDFYDILLKVKESAAKKYFDGQYFNLKKASASLSLAMSLNGKFRELQRSVRKESKKYLARKGEIILFVGLFVLMYIGFFVHSLSLVFTAFLAALLSGIVGRRSALYSSYSGENYKEYQKWRAFRKYLSRSFTIKSGKHETVKMWDKFLVYATALGVSKKVIKELKAHGLIDDKEMRIYTGIPLMSSSFAHTTGTHSGGGFGGAGGGGVGGGGGGGR